jgi:hypothetical protein
MRLVFFAALVCLLAFASLEAQELTDDMVLAFSFNEGAGNEVKDLSQSGNHGKIVGKATWVDGKLGKALYFDGATYVVAPYIPFDRRNFTVQLWAKPDEIGVEQVVFSQYELNSDNLSLHLRIQPDGAIRMGFYSNDLDSPPASVKKNEWHNLTFRFDESLKERKIYVDGVEIASDVSASSYLGAKGEVWIGGWERPTKDEHPFYQIYQGAIDEVRVWHRLLNEEEIISSLDTEMPVEPLEKMATMWGKVKLDR